MRTPAYPFEASRRIGSVSAIAPATVKVNLPRAGERSVALHYGDTVRGGEVGEFVAIEAGPHAVIGRLIAVDLPTTERLEVEPRSSGPAFMHPLGVVQLLATVDLGTWAVRPGLQEYPRVGSQVYSASGPLIRWVITTIQQDSTGTAPITVDLGRVESAGGTSVVVTPEQLFGRHCAVLGTTGGGKSWTLARLVEQVARYRSKVILLDPTGEYADLDGRVSHLHVGRAGGYEDGKEVSVPYRQFDETDLFALFSPSGQAQAPKLREAMKSLKLAEQLGSDHDLVIDGCIPKADREKKPFDDACRDHKDVLGSPKASFDVEGLSKQVFHECVFPTPYSGSGAKWGGASERDYTFCMSLIYRIDTVLASKELEAIFGMAEFPSAFDEIEAFMGDDATSVLRVSLRDVPFQFLARELVANAIGRYLLGRAREGAYADKPAVVVLDEAHHFLSKWIGDEFARFPLDAFELIAKEGRKYGLTIALATQRPRDIPEGVLSQMGTLVVHRLINDDDRKVVERASGELDRSASAFLPTLGPGEAILIGVAFPIPLPIRVGAPTNTPRSFGPRYQQAWSEET